MGGTYVNIYEKLLSISRDASAVAKNLTVGIGKSSYKAVGEADVLAAVKPLEAKYGVYSYPISRRIINAEVYTAKNDYGEKSTQFVRLETVYRFVNIEKPDEYVEITTYGDGVDPQDKAPGKAMTYADKYALLKAYKLITGDDPDQYPSGDIGTPQPNGAPARDEHRLVTDTQRAEMAELGMKIEDVAVYCKKTPETLTEAEAAKAISLKRDRRRKAAENGKPAEV